MNILDEALHLAGTQRMLQTWMHGNDTPEMQECALRNLDPMIAIFKDAAEQEKAWADYLFQDGSMIGLNAAILHEYIEYITDVRITALGMPRIYNKPNNPLPWMNSWLVSDNVQSASQETEQTSYITGGLDSNVTNADFADLTI
ncbi:MAG: ribonucleotide-diphosphate reductase subunit beta [Thiomicrorhabdus sp.]|nr:ribonucleotide-diphosphate reductase subunit beta [Thiomicrorhabdus sp.]